MTTLGERLAGGDVIILDGAMGTELQRKGVPTEGPSWSGAAPATHPDVVRQIHKEYVEAGADVLITNTFSSARHILDLVGLGDRAQELNAKAVRLAREAVDQVSPDRPTYIAGSLSTYLLVGHFRPNITVPLTEVRTNFLEQAETLAEAGVDLLVLEMMQDLQYASTCLEAALAPGLPVWVGFSTVMGADGATVELRSGEAGHTFAGDLKDLLSIGGDVVAIMHTTPLDTTPALDVLAEHWQGPMAAYPHVSDGAARGDLSGIVKPMEFLAITQDWASKGVQAIGACCGFGPEYIRALKEGLPTKVPR